MAQYDLLKQALANAMQYNEKPTQYVDIYGGYLEGLDRGRKNKQLQRASDMQDELEDAMSGMENPSEDELLDTSFKVKTKYGDAEGARQILKYRNDQILAEAAAKEKQHEKLMKQLKDIADFAEKDPELARRARALGGANNTIDDEMIGRINAEGKRKGRGDGGSEKFKIFYDKEGNPITVSADRGSVDSALKKGYRPGKTADDLLGAIEKMRGGDEDTGSDIAARESSAPKLSSPPRPPREGMKWVRNSSTGELKEVKK